MAGLTQGLLSILSGYGRGQMARAEQEEEARRLSEAEETRRRRDLLDLLSSPGFQFEPGGGSLPGLPSMNQAGPVAPPAAGPLDAVMGAGGAPPMEPPPMPIEGVDVSVPPSPMRVGSIDLGEMQGDVMFDPSKTREKREETRQRSAWSQLPRDEYPVFIDGFDYVQEYGDWQERQREEREIEQKRSAVAKALGLSPQHPDVEAIVRYNLDPELYRARRREKPSTTSGEATGTRLAWQEEDRERERIVKEAEGIAASQAAAGQGQLEILTALRAAGFHHKLSDGVILGIIAKALRDYGG